MDMMMLLWFFISILRVFPSAMALDNGVALTPPMGWLTWQRFRCTVDCKKFPDDCISEALIKRTAQLMVSEGYLRAGYEYIVIDDCWLEDKRGPDGRMVPDKIRFPNGMKAVSDYVHSLGLKFGMYQDYGTRTCAGYPGVLRHEKVDIQTFVDWEIDYLKLDGCNVNVADMDKGYPAFGKLLNKTGRPIVYSCSWPAYQDKPKYASIAEHCNLWRNWGDIQDSWQSVTTITNWFGDNQHEFAQFAGPGHWNDPDMLVIGNFGLSIDQARAQMAIWSVMAAPLIMSVDLATVRPEFKEILLNKDIIGVDQDPLGKQGLRISKGDHDIWTRELANGSYAVVFLNKDNGGAPSFITYGLNDLKLPDKNYLIKDLYHEEKDRNISNDQSLEVRVNPSGVKFYKFTPQKH